MQRYYIISFVAAFFVGSLFFDGSFVFAQTATSTIYDLQQKINLKSDEILKLTPLIKQLERDIDTTVTQKKTLGTEIKTLDLTKKKLETDIKITQTKVDTTDLKIRQLSSEISYQQDEISARVAALKEAVLAIFEHDEVSLAQVALSQDSFTGLWYDLESLEEFTRGINENVDQLKMVKTDLEQKNIAKQTEKEKLLDLKSSLADQKKIAENNKNQKTQLLKLTSTQEAQFQKTLKAQLALKDSLENELRDYESTLKYILDPKSIPPRGKKVFMPPMDVMRITQNFGKTSSSGRLYASGTHSGTDFAASPGTPVRAMLSGVVIGAGDTDLACPGGSYGRWVLIKHDNGLASIYAHFSLTKVIEGQIVNTGDLIGYSGNTGYSTGPHLHLGVFVADAVRVENLPSKSCGGRTYRMPVAAFNAYLDPMDYL